MAHLPAVTFPGFLRRLFLGTTALLPAAMAQAQAPNAVPTGGQVSAGQATITQSGTQTQVTQGSNRAVVDWQRFDVGRNSSVNFTQPNAQSWTLNRVQTPDPSMIAGRITANGGVAIVNQSGVVFTPGSQVNVGSLIASTANITNQNFMAGRMDFNERGREGARVENHGSITVADRGLAALVGPGAANTGTIRARLGTAVVAGAETFRLDLAGDGMLSLEITDSVRRTANGNAALVTNSGVIEAQGGQVILSAHAASGLVESVVRNTGRVAGRNVTVTGQGGNVEIAAGSVTARGGNVSITAPDSAVVVGPQARVSASSRQGGGQVQLGGATTAAVRVEGRVSARGTGGNATGGRVAVQARDSVTLAPTAVVNASGSAGGGTVLLGTTGVGRAQTMARETRVESGAVVRVDATTNGNGGIIVVNSAESTLMLGTLSARGGAMGGDGGFIEVSAMRNIRLNGVIDVMAPRGQNGTFLLDPVNIEVRTAVAVPPGEVDDAVPPGGTFVTDGAPLDPTTVIIAPGSIEGFAGSVVLQAQQNLTVTNLINKVNGGLTLIADTGTLAVNAGITVSGALVLTATAGAITTTANVSGVGVTMNAGLGITLGGAVAGNAGAVNITAGGNLAVNQAVSSTGGAVNLTSTGGSFTQGAAGTVTATGQIITVRADTMTIAAALNAGAGGTVVLQRQSAGSISIGAGGDTALAAADLQTHVSAGTLRLAATGTATVAENFVSPAATLELNGAGGASVDVGVTVSGLTLLSNQSGSLTNSGTITTTAGSVQASTALSNLGTGIITGSATAGTGLTNAGSITGNATATNGLLGNQAGGSIGGNAVSTAAAVNNAGTITGTVTAQTDVTNTATGTINGATITATTGNVLNAGAITPAAPLTITAGGNITQNGTLNAGANAVNLNAGGAISGSGGVTGTTLTVRGAAGVSTSRAGSLNLTTGNAIATLDARTNNAALTFAQVAALSVTQADAGTGAVTLGSDGAVTGGGIVGGTFTLRGAGLGTTRAGSLDLTTGNAIATLDGRTNNAALTFAQVAALSVTQADAGTGAVTLGSDGAITGGGVVGGTFAVRGAGLGTTRAGGLNLTTGNAIATLDARTNNAALTFAQVGALSVTQADAGTGAVTLGSDGAITGGGVVGGTFTVRGAGLGTTRAGSLDLTTGNTIATLDARTNNAALTFAQVAALSVTQADAGTGAVTLGSDGAITGGGVVGGTFTVRGAGLGTTRAGGLNLTTGNAIATLDARTNNTALTFAQAGALSVTQADAGTGAVTLSTTGATSLTISGAVTGGIINLTGGQDLLVNALVTGTGLATLGATAGDITTTANISVVGVTMNAGGAITLGGTVAGNAGAVSATASTAINVNAAVSSGGAGVSLTSATFTQTAGGTVTTTAAGQTITVRADTMTIAAALNAGATGTVALRRNTAGSVSIGAGGDTAHAATDLQTHVTAQTLRLVASTTVTVAEAFVAPAGMTTLALDGAGGVTVNAPVTVGLLLADAGSLINNSTITGSVTALTDLTNEAGGTINGAAITATNGNVLNQGSISSAAPLTITAGGNITLNGTQNAGANAVNLNAGGTISGTAGVVGTTLTVRGADGTPTSRAGSLNLTTGNAITTLDARTNNAELTFGQVGALAITQADAGTGNVTLRSDGAITRSAGVTTGVVGSLLTVRGATGDAATRAASLNLTEGTVTTGNAIATLDARTNNAELTFGQVGALAITQADTGTGNVTLRSDGAITRSAGVTTGVVGSLLTVRGATGDAATRAASLNLTEGTVTTGNAIATLDARTNNAELTFGQVGALAITQADAGTGNVTLRSDGAITRSAGVTTGVVGSLLTVRGATGDAATRAASLNLTEGTVTTGNAIATLDARTNNAELTFGQVGALAITQADAGTGNVTLRSDGAITRSAGVTTGVVGSLLTVRGATGDAATRAASLNLTEGTVTTGNAIATLDARTNNAELTFGQVGGLAITQADAGTGNVTLRSDGAITRSAGVTTGVVGSLLTVRGATGDAATRAASLNLTEGTVTTGNAIATLDARTNNAELTFGQVGALAITQADAGTGNVTLRSDGAITRSAGVTTGVVGSLLTVRGATGDAATRAASLNLTEGTVTTGNAIATLDARTNNAELTFGQVGALAITQADAGTGNVTLRSDGAITRSAGVTTGVVGSLLTVRGATGDAATRAASLNLTEGTVTTGNAITTLDARTNNAELTFGQVGALAITQADAGTGNVTLRSDGAITRSAGVTTGVVGSLLTVRGATGDAATRAASLNLTEGTVTTGNAIATLDARTNNAELTFGQVGGLAITQTDAGTGNVTLRSDGAITRSAGVTTGVVGSLLTVRGATGDAATRAASLNLTEGTVTTGNAIATLDARTNNAELTFGQVGALAITQADAGTGNVTLRSDGAITRSAGVTTGVVGSLLTVRGATGDAATRAASLNLTEGTVTTGNAIATLDARTNNAELTFGQVGALAITQADAGTGNVTLRSDGAITRSAGVTTGVVGSLLTVRGATGDAATRAASLNLTEGTVTTGNAIATLDARTNNAELTFGQVGALAITQADAGTGNVTLRSDGAITRSAGVTTGVVGSLLTVRGATGDAATRAASLNLTEGTVTTGNAIATLDARTNNAELTFGQVGALAITQADAGTGNVTLRSDGAITRSAGVTTGVVGSLLTVRGATGDAATRAASLNLTEGTVTTGNAITTLDARTNNAELTFGQVGALAITQADAGTGNVTLRSDGAITGVTVRGVSLTVRGAAGGTSRAGSLNLNTGNAITSLDARTNNAALTFAQTGALAITQADAGTGAVTLGSDGAITGNNVIGSSLTVRGAGLAATRAASLDLTGNAINSLDALVNNAALTFGQVNGFSVTQANAGTGNVALLSDGAITGTGGVTAATLTLRGAVGGTSRAGSVNLTTGNAITNLDARTNNGALTFAQVGGIILTQLDTGTGNATLRSDGAISNTGAVNTALLTVRGAAGGNTPAESLTLTGANNIGALDVLVRGALGLSLASGTSIQQLGSSAGSVQITANGTLAVTGPVTAALDMTLLTTSGDVSIVPGGTLSGGRATTLTAANNILLAGGTLSAGTALTITAGQDAIMTGGITSAASLGTSTQGVSAGRDFLWNGGSVALPTIHAVTAGRDLGLRTSGGATTVLGNLTAGRNLAVETTAGALTLQGNTVRASGGTLDLRAAGNLGVFGANLLASGVMTLRATGSLSSNPSSFTAESISLISGAGLSFTQGTLNATQNLTAEVTGDITFQNSSLRASTALADNPAAFRVLRLVATGNLSLRSSSVTADRVEFVAGGTMTTAGSSFNLGTGLLLSARSGVGQANEALTTVAALDNSRLPLVIYDTRSGIFLTKLPDLLTSATTDQPSRTFNAQTWQVPQVTSTAGQLLFGVNDGAPTPPTNAVAGAVQINMNAGSSPVFMLLNGGTASGFITAARLGVYGLPGSTPLPDGRTLNLTGTLGGVGGEGAARFGILGSATGTQPSPFALDLYRFNNCVISSVNCVVPTFLQLPTIPLINSVILGIQQPGFDDRDVLLPNVAEKDF